MLTRLRVRGFKNLVDVDVRFGAVTCVAGPNAVGKSNLFDAILFLSALADKSLLEAATGVRQETSSANAGRIFTRGGKGKPQTISLQADMIVPAEVKDDLDQAAKPAIRFLTYTVEVGLFEEPGSTIPRLELRQEELTYYTRTQGRTELPFARGRKGWLDSVLVGKRNSPFISTEKGPGGVSIKLHEDSGHQGRARQLKAETLSRTVLSTINTAESPTALAARREMQSWRLLQLEPTRLRAPDDMKASPSLGPDGRGLPATLHRLLAPRSHGGRANGLDAPALRAELGNRLAELVEDIREVRVDRDEKRELLTLMVKDKSSVEFRARDLSDGTLRFLALAVLEMDHTWEGLMCMEEPENGIHPRRIPAMLQLLQDLAVDLAQVYRPGRRRMAFRQHRRAVGRWAAV